jgi:hypothetical protein
MSDPETRDVDRTGDDLLARIDELTDGKTPEGADGDGWRFLLLACKREIECYEAMKEGVQERIADLEKTVAMLTGLLYSLAGYAGTCQRSNTIDWMRGLTVRLNEVCKATNDPDRFEFNHAAIRKAKP